MHCFFQNVNINLAKGDKVAIISRDSRATSAFYEIINNNRKADAGDFKWGVMRNLGQTLRGKTLGIIGLG